MTETVSGTGIVVTRNNEKKSPLQLKYIKILQLFLWPSGAWPAHVFGESMALCFRVLRVVHPFQTFNDLIGEIYYLSCHYDTITVFDFGHVVITIFLTIVTIARQSLPNFKTYGLVIKDFIDNFHMMHYKNDGEDYYLKVYEFTDKFSYFFAIYQMAMMVVGMTLFNILPIYNNYKMGAFHHPREMNLTLDYAVFYEFPYFRQDEHFYKTTIVNLYLSYNCSTSICCIDLLLSLMVFQVIGRIKLLMCKLEHIPRPKNLNKVSNILQDFCPVHNSTKVKMYDEEENKAIHFKLIEVIDDHRNIVTFADTISDFFGPMLALNYLFHLVGGCILLLECSQKDPGVLARFLPLTVIIFGQLIQLSIIFEVVGYMSEKLIDSVYQVPWEYMNVSNQQSVRFILSRIQTPLEVTAMGIVPVGVKTMQSILKTTFSFFAFLQSINE